MRAHGELQGPEESFQQCRKVGQEAEQSIGSIERGRRERERSEV